MADDIDKCKEIMKNVLFEKNNIAYSDYETILGQSSNSTVKIYARQYSESLYHKFKSLREEKYKLFKDVLNKSDKIIGKDAKGGEYANLTAQGKYVEALGLMYGALTYGNENVDSKFRILVNSVLNSTPPPPVVTPPVVTPPVVTPPVVTPPVVTPPVVTPPVVTPPVVTPPVVTPPAKTGHKYVLMIGVNGYTYINGLGCCENDVEGMKQCLGDNEKWKDADIKIFKSGEATKEEIQNWFLNLSKKIKPEDQVLFVFSGHGTNTGGEGYICPVDTNFNDDGSINTNTLISGEELAEWRDSLGAATTAFIIDSCFSGKIPGDFEGDKATDEGKKKRKKIKFLTTKSSTKDFDQNHFYNKLAQSRYKDKAASTNPTIIVTASNGDQYSEENPDFTVEGLSAKGYGAFMGWLMKGLGVGNALGQANADKDKDISLADEAYKWARDGIEKDGYEQRPQVFYSGSEGGEYYNWNIKGADAVESPTSPDRVNLYRDPNIVKIEKSNMRTGIGSAVVKGKVFVLSIGINTYDKKGYASQYDSSPNDLKWCVSDARGVKTAMQSSLCPEKNVIVLEDGEATWANVEAQVKAIKAKMGPDDKFIFYFSGHGTNDGTEGKICLYDKMVTGSELAKLRKDVIGSNEVSFIFDSCQNGAMIGRGVNGKTAAGDSKVSANTRYFKYGKTEDALNTSAQNRFVETLATDKGLAIKNTFVLTSCRGDELSSEYDNIKHGVFTYELLKGLKGKHIDRTRDGYVSMEEIIRFVIPSTRIASSQAPEWMGLPASEDYIQHPQYMDGTENQFVIKALK